jgi:hypothetical protein
MFVFCQSSWLGICHAACPILVVLLAFAGLQTEGIMLSTPAFKCLVKRRIYSNSGSEFHPDTLSPEAGAAIGPVPVPTRERRRLPPNFSSVPASPRRLGLPPYLQRRPMSFSSQAQRGSPPTLLPRRRRQQRLQKARRPAPILHCTLQLHECACPIRSRQDRKPVTVRCVRACLMVDASDGLR